ncbi:MAG: 4-alpha-glucanotransferase [Treponema sp.]|nr:4-alpha-glucanotransferase [Treponema sp.]
MAEKSFKKLTGVAVPLGALYTKENPVIGEFADLVPFAKVCKEAGLGIIQLLPVNDTGTQSSPYSGLSAFALHPIYIRIKDIPGFDDLYKSDAKFKKAYDDFIAANAYTLRYDYDSILNTKTSLLMKLYDSSQVGKSGTPDEALESWIKSNSWIKTYAVYKNLKWNYMQASWKSWHEDDKEITAEQITKRWNTKAFKKEHLFYAWCQMLAAGQFEAAVAEVHKMGLLLKGDMPILMNEDSCDAWAYPEFFNHDLRAGSPSDGENPAGQNWGFPTYNWKNLKAQDYSWWKQRLKTASRYYDAYRLDHILGFFRIWAIPSTDCNALTGHTEPYASFKIDDLYELGFDDDRIRWLSRPHIPTSAVEDITWNREVAHKILETCCTQIENEELWLFDNSIKGNAQLAKLNLTAFVDEPAQEKIRQKLSEYWSNRTLLEVSKNKFIPLWTYNQSTSWQSLNVTEKTALEELFTQLGKKNTSLWKKQADEIFNAITSGLKMIPCGEDLGVGISCVPETMKKHNILGLRVVRWCREWSEEGQPYVPFKNYEPLSVTTTSVHDSSTIREWWETEKQSAEAFIKANPAAFGLKEDAEGPLFDKPENEISQGAKTLAQQEFSPELAQTILKVSSTSASQWFIPPLQDFLYMEKSFWLPKASDERINIPGTVTKFNWTYRMPCAVEELAKDDELIQKITSLSRVLQCKTR